MADTQTKDALWEKSPTANLMRYVPKGSYYLRARVNGKIIRESLKTTSYAVAKIKLAERLRELRMSNGGAVDCVPETLGEAISMVRTKISLDPNLKARSREAYKEALARLQPGKRAAVPTIPLLKLQPEHLADWWANASREYRPQSANHLLMFVKQALQLARRAGGIFSDPAQDLRPIKIPRTRLDLPTREQFSLVVASIRSAGRAKSEERANWVQFMAFSGLRPCEIDSVRWEHVSETDGVISVYGGAEGTKNRHVRHVPITPPMQSLLAQMRNGAENRGLIFGISKPAQALRKACKQIGIPHQRIYNLRHLFATVCRDSGVPVPTFAEWLGHKDGGALAMRTYVQKSDEHTQKAAKLVTFS